MGFFKESGGASSTVIAWLQQLTWALIYAGLLCLVLGLSMRRTDDALGWSLVVGGAVVAALGFVLIYVRSKMKVGP